MRIAGIDVSAYQGTIDWAAVKETGFVQFAYAKASEGETEIDSQFARNKSVCAMRGIPFGAYHFFHPDEDPRQQAAHFQHTAGTCPLLPMVDVEIDNGMSAGAIVSALKQFLAAIGTKRVVIYSDYGFWNDSMAGASDFASYPFWVAEYNNDREPTLPRGWSSWVLWQHSCTGHIDGIEGDADLDVLNPSVTLNALRV